MNLRGGLIVLGRYFLGDVMGAVRILLASAKEIHVARGKPVCLFANCSSVYDVGPLLLTKTSPGRKALRQSPVLGGQLTISRLCVAPRFRLQIVAVYNELSYTSVSEFYI